MRLAAHFQRWGGRQPAMVALSYLAGIPILAGACYAVDTVVDLLTTDSAIVIFPSH